MHLHLIDTLKIDRTNVNGMVHVRGHHAYSLYHIHCITMIEKEGTINTLLTRRTHALTSMERYTGHAVIFGNQ